MRNVWLVIGRALLPRAPVLGWGFFMDDIGHQLVLEDPSTSPTMSSFRRRVQR